jgi:hypothetical protein
VKAYIKAFDSSLSIPFAGGYSIGLSMSFLAIEREFDVRNPLPHTEEASSPMACNPRAKASPPCIGE